MAARKLFPFPPDHPVRLSLSIPPSCQVNSELPSLFSVFCSDPVLCPLLECLVSFPCGCASIFGVGQNSFFCPVSFRLWFIVSSSKRWFAGALGHAYSLPPSYATQQDATLPMLQELLMSSVPLANPTPGISPQQYPLMQQFLQNYLQLVHIFSTHQAFSLLLITLLSSPGSNPARTP